MTRFQKTEIIERLNIPTARVDKDIRNEIKRQIIAEAQESGEEISMEDIEYVEAEIFG